MKKGFPSTAGQEQGPAAAAVRAAPQLFPGLPYPHPVLPRQRFWRRSWLPLLLLLTSLVTICGSGARFMHDFKLGRPPLASENDFFPLPWVYAHPSDLKDGWSFCLALLSILLAHEAGHFFYCEKAWHRCLLALCAARSHFERNGRSRYPHPFTHSFPQGADRSRDRRTYRGIPRCRPHRNCRHAAFKIHRRSPGAHACCASNNP